MRLVVVEDNPLVREQLLRLLAQYPRIKVLGYATEEQAAVDLIFQLNPDGLILDLSLGEGSGLQVLSQIRAVGMQCRVFILSNFTSETLRKSCEAYGIDGFYDKSHETTACLDHLNSWSAS